MRLFRNALIMAVVMLGLLLGCEVVARAFLWRAAGAQASPVEFGYSAGGYGDLLPNLDSTVRLLPIRPFYLHTNSAGLRNVDEIEANDEIFRVLALGDSFTFGYYVHNHETFPARLEEHLNQRGTGRFQVLNAGVPGYTIEDELAYLREKGLALRPDLVILGVYTNDIFDMTPQIRQYFARPVVLEAQAAPTPPGTLETFLRDNSALYHGLLTLSAGVGQAQIESQVNSITPQVAGLMDEYQNLTFLTPDAVDFRDEWESYERLLREMVDVLRDEDIPLVIVLFPDLAQMPTDGGLPPVPQDFFARVSADTQTPYLDLLPVFRQAGDIQSLYLMYYNPDAQVKPDAPDAAVMIYSGDGHPSPYGHLVTARVLVELLLDEGLVP